MSKNPITGDEIKSRSLSTRGRDNWDKIYAKKTAEEWRKQFHPQIKILDPDGWRHNDSITLDTPISYKDFLNRLQESTCLGYICDPDKLMKGTLI